jgi:short-subunit dehydrogenase
MCSCLSDFAQASKAAALNFYDTLRMELGGDIRITEVVPGVVESEITKGKILSKDGEMVVDQDERDVRRLLPIALNAFADD